MVQVLISLWKGEVPPWNIYVTERMELWSRCVAKPSDIAKVHPHVAYAALTHGLCNKWT